MDLRIKSLALSGLCFACRLHPCLSPCTIHNLIDVFATGYSEYSETKMVYYQGQASKPLNVQMKALPLAVPHPAPVCMY